MDKFVKKWQSNSNVANTTQQQSPANEEEQTPTETDVFQSVSTDAIMHRRKALLL